MEELNQDQKDVWKTKTGGLRKFTDLTDKQLQNVLYSFQRQELYYHNRTMLYGQKQDTLLEEAVSRGIKLQHLDEAKESIGDFFEKKRRVKKSIGTKGYE